MVRCADRHVKKREEGAEKNSNNDNEKEEEI